MAADDAAKVSRYQRESQALELRVSGTRLDVIAKELGVSYKQAKKDIAAAIKRVGRRSIEHSRALLERQFDQDLEMLNREVTKLYEVPDAKWNPQVSLAVASLARTKTRIADTRARLLGLNAPVKADVRVQHEVSGAIGVIAAQMSDDRWTQLVERAKERRHLQLVPGRK